MRGVLAERVLAHVVDRGAARLSGELLDLALLAEFKYDEYGQFSPGMRLIESLSLCLAQFKGDDQEAVYRLVRDWPVFVSSAEMQHYIKTAHADHAKPILVREADRQAGICEDHIARIMGSKKFGDLGKKCLYLGLSDGSKIDDFRRFSLLRRGQVYSLHETAGRRKSRMLEKLARSIGSGPGSNTLRFEIVFLVDDFSASGLSYIHEKDGRFEGRIIEFVEQFDGAAEGGRAGPGPPEGGLGGMFAPSLLVVAPLYAATDAAADRTRKHASKMFEKRGIRLGAAVVHEMRAATLTSEGVMGAVEPILAASLDGAMPRGGHGKGGQQRPHLGFDKCGLLAVLSHNCPNNTLPIIRHESDDGPRTRALFPQRKRFGGG